MSGVIRDPRTGQQLTFVATAKTTDGELLRAELRLAPGGRVPRHVHLRIDERLELISGEVVFRLGRDTHRLEPGHAVEVPRRSMHVLHNVGAREAVLVLEVRPARRTQGLMRAMFAASRALGRVGRRRTA